MKDNNHIQIKIKIPTNSQDTPMSTKAQDYKFKDVDILNTFKIEKESQ